MIISSFMEENVSKTAHFTYWLMEKKSWVFSFFAGALLLFSTVLFFQARAKAEKENTFLKAEKAFLGENNKELYLALEKYPELHKIYDAPLVKRLIEEGDKENAIKLMNGLLKRVEKTTDVEFSKITLLIVEEKYSEAYKQASALNLDPNSLLSAYNMLRICSLQRVLQDKAELTSIDNLLKHPAFALLDKELSYKKVSLKEYLFKRKAELSPTS